MIFIIVKNEASCRIIHIIEYKRHEIAFLRTKSELLETIRFTIKKSELRNTQIYEKKSQKCKMQIFFCGGKKLTY